MALGRPSGGAKLPASRRPRENRKAECAQYASPHREQRRNKRNQTEIAAGTFFAAASQTKKAANTDGKEGRRGKGGPVLLGPPPY